jgi:hypothetical protein
MGKRKPVGELKSTPVQFQVQRYKELAGLRAEASQHWGVNHIQPFFPSLERMFKTDHLENAREHGIKFDPPIQSIPSSDSVMTNALHTIHIKQTMLVSPFKWMRGDFGRAIGLPTTRDEADAAHEKMQSPYNAAYVGSLFAAVLSQSGCIHFPKVHGVFTGVAERHTVDISDDYPDICERPWFSQNIGNSFELRMADGIMSNESFQHTRNVRTQVCLSDESAALDDVVQLDGIATDAHEDVSILNRVFVEQADTEEDASDCSSVSTSYVFGIRSCDCSDIDPDEDIEEEIDEGYAWATLSNVPVQLTVMERCAGTLYQLMCLNPDTRKHFAWVCQVVFALLFAQRTFGFVHNDLHANNIMYVETDKEFLWYKVEDKVYRVPTYGYVMKIIDFERGTGSVRVTGMKHAKFFMSDHFSPIDEASGQYNIDPFHVTGIESIKPNPSFDCVRLATSLFWDLFPEGPSHLEYASNPLFQLLMRWLTLPDGTSIFFGKKTVKHDRFHGFHLYKAIARLCKDTAIPRKEVAAFAEFEVKDGPLEFDILV